MSPIIALLAFLLFIPPQINAQSKKDAPLMVAKAWWHAATFGDTASLKKLSTNDITVTFSVGRRFTRKEIIAQVAKHDPNAKFILEWTDIVQQSPNPNTVIISGRIIETVRGNPGYYKYMTVLTKAGTAWKVAAVQSTRETELSARIPVSQAGNLNEYAGSYRTPAGTTLMIEVKDSLLILKDPTGAETVLEPIGPGLFEPPALHLVGNVRMFFGRDTSGRVTSLNRITNRVITMQRVQ